MGTLGLAIGLGIGSGRLPGGGGGGEPPAGTPQHLLLLMVWYV